MHSCMHTRVSHAAENYRVPAKAWDGYWIHSARSMGRYLFKGLIIKVGVESIPTSILKGVVQKHPCGAGWGLDSDCVSCPTKCHSLFQQLLHCQTQVFNHYMHTDRGHAPLVDSTAHIHTHTHTHNNYYIDRLRYSITTCMQTEPMHTFQIHYPSENQSPFYLSNSTDGAQYHSSYHVYGMWIEFADGVALPKSIRTLFTHSCSKPNTPWI